MIYMATPPGEPLSQGGILDACPIFGLEAAEGAADLDAAPARWCERVVVLTQACDLAQTKTTKVPVALLHTAQLLVERGILKAPAIRDQVRRGMVYGWYFLPAAPEPIALPESIIDLHDLHTVPRAALASLIAKGQRVCRLLPPYREHLGAAFCGDLHANRPSWPLRDAERRLNRLPDAKAIAPDGSASPHLSRLRDPHRMLIGTSAAEEVVAEDRAMPASGSRKAASKAS